MPATAAPPVIFVSHSYADQARAKALADLFKSALSLPAKAIRCTSAHPYKLKGGVHTETELRREVNESTVVVGLLSESSVASLYVAFELGARWGNQKPIVPVFAPGFDPSQLTGPLSATHGEKIAGRADVVALLDSVSEIVGRPLESPNAFEGELQALLSVAVPAASPEAKKYNLTLPDEAPSTASLNDVDGDRSIKEYDCRAECMASHRDDFQMQEYCIRRQEEARSSLLQPKPSDIPMDIFVSIRANAEKSWPNDYRLRLHTEQKQIASWRKVHG